MIIWNGESIYEVDLLINLLTLVDLFIFNYNTNYL
jgi:hypothetical protein